MGLSVHGGLHPLGQARKSQQLLPSWFLDIFEVISLYRLKNQHEAAPQLMSIGVGLPGAGPCDGVAPSSSVTEASLAVTINAGH